MHHSSPGAFQFSSALQTIASINKRKQLTMCISSGEVLNWNVPTTTEMDPLNTQVHMGEQMKSHLKIIYRNDSPSTKGSMELLMDPVHGKEMLSNSQTYLKETHYLKSFWKETGVGKCYWDRGTDFVPEWGLGF